MKTQLQAELRFLFSPDVDSMEDFAPEGPFGILVQALVGETGGKGEESFDFMLCTPDWFASRMTGDFKSGRHYLFVQSYDYAKLERFVRDYCTSCEGETWDAVAEKLSRLGMWEFEDYVPHSEPARRL